MGTNQNPTPNPSTEGNQLDIFQPENSRFSNFLHENTLYKQWNPELGAPPYSRCVGIGGSPSSSLVIKLSCFYIGYRLPGGHWEISRLGHNIRDWDTARTWISRVFTSPFSDVAWSSQSGIEHGGTSISYESKVKYLLMQTKHVTWELGSFYR